MDQRRVGLVAGSETDRKPSMRPILVIFAVVGIDWLHSTVGTHNPEHDLCPGQRDRGLSRLGGAAHRTDDL